MSNTDKWNSAVAGLFVCAGLMALGYLLQSAALKFKEYERTVVAKGLSEREMPADVVIWPIKFTVASDDLTGLYNSLESQGREIKAFLVTKGVKQDNITFSTPVITDKLAQEYGSNSKAQFRYVAAQTVTVYSRNVELVRRIMGSLSELGKKGIAFAGNDYDSRTEYLFTKLNEIKPEMIEEATKKAREVAEKFEADSHSRLGKIKRARQGQFTITPRDKNNPHIKKVRVVSTVEYYLSD